MPIESISFHNYGGESAGSIAKKHSGNIYLQNGPAESAGSIAKKHSGNIYLQNGPAESAGTIANKPSKNVSFQGSYYDDYYEDKKGSSAIGKIGGLAGAVALGIVALGYGHKKNVFSKMKDGWFKKVLSHLEKPAEKCHSWCHTVKDKGLSLWDKAKNIFKRK